MLMTLDIWSPLLKVLNLDSHILEHLTHLPVAENSTGFTLTFCLLIVFSSITFKRDGRSLSLPVKSFIYSKKPSNPRILPVREFIGFFLKGHLTGQTLQRESQCGGWMGKEACRAGSPGKRDWGQEAAVKLMSAQCGSCTKGEWKKKRTKDKFLPFLPWLLYLQPMSWSPVVHAKVYFWEIINFNV